MTTREQIWQCAKRDLVLRTPEGHDDVFLWEHSCRVAQNALWIVAQCAAGDSQPIDALTVESAALYHDAGWACQYRDGGVERCEILAGPTTDAQREIAARMLGASLARHLRGAALEQAVTAVLRMNERPAPTPEARIVGDAESLDEIGNLSLWGLLRRHAWQGRGAGEAIHTWKSQRAFSFWEARIKASFHFDVCRRLAAERLARLDAIVAEIGKLHCGEDLVPAEPNGGAPIARVPLAR